ncbi:LCP family protein [Streptomyces sp. NPDC003691]
MTESAGTPAGSDGPDGDGGDDAAGERAGAGAEHRVPPPVEPEGTGGPDPDVTATDPDRDGPTPDATAPDTAGPDAKAPADPAARPGAPDPAPATPGGSTPDSGNTGDSTVAERIPHAAPDGDSAVPPGPAADAPPAPRRKRRWLRWTALGVSVALLGGSATAWWFYRKLDGNITTDTATAVELETFEKERPVQVSLDAKNVLLMGSDSRRGEGNSKYGRDDGGSQRADTVILLHIAADRQSSTSVSIPRDLMATIPSCRRPDGSRTEEHLGQFNSAFETGGAACTIRTVELMTGVRIDHHIVVDFSGFTKMVDAVDGVEVCLKEPVDDPDAHLNLPEGRQTLDGEEALGYVRARKSIGNGSDTERMDRQQQFLGSLVQKVQSDGVLLNPAKLYPVLDAATKSLTTDPGLDSLKDLYDLTRSLRNVPTENVQFLTVPRRPWANNRNRDELVQPQASVLFKQLREDLPITILTPGARAAAEADRKNGSPSGKPGTSGKSGTPVTSGTEQGPGAGASTPPGGAGKPPGDSADTPGAPGSSASPSNSPSFAGTNAAVGVCD